MHQRGGAAAGQGRAADDQERGNKSTLAAPVVTINSEAKVLKIRVMSSTAELTTKQAKFVAEYLVDGNGAGAAVRAGYSPSGAHVTASRMLRNATPVARAIETRQTSDATRLSLRRDDVLAGLLEAVDQARAQGNPAALVSAWKTIAHLQGYFSLARVKLDVAVTGNVDMDRLTRLSDAELLKMVAAGTAGVAC